MSFNEKLSYTEHVVSAPTTDFAIGFTNYGYSSDTINVFVDNVSATEAGYTVTRKSDMVVELQPAVESGVVRLQRETNLDASFYNFTAGAKFVAANMDANFKQVLHSQQETRDGFDKLAGDVYPLVNGLEVALEKAEEASQAAQEAADAAEEAAQVARGASQVIYNSVQTQQEINNLLASQGVNILSVYGGINDFGVALELAFAKAMSTTCRKIIIPDGTFSAKTTADLTLTSNFTLQLGGGTVINADNRVDIINVTQGNYTLNILGGGASIYPNWTSGSNTVAALRLNSHTLGKSLLLNNLNVFEKGTDKFTNGINAVGLNYSSIVDCIVQAVNPLVNASVSSGVDVHSMGTEVINCKLHADNTTVTLINNGELGCEGWKFKGGEYFGKTGIEVIDNLTSATYYPPLLLVDGVHINAQRFFSLSGLSRVKITSCDLQSQVTANSTFKGLIEFDGVQVFDIDETTAISQANTTGTAPNDSLPVYYLRNSLNGRTTAFLEFGIENYWLQQTAPLIAFDTAVSLVGRVNFGKLNTEAFTGVIVTSANAKKVGLSVDTALKNTQVGTGISNSTDISFNSSTGVLTLNSKPSIGDVYLLPTAILPNNSTINQIKVKDNIGKEFTLIIDASNVTLNHSVNLYTPVGVQNRLLYGATLRVVSFNSDLCRVTSVTNNASILPATVPTSTAASGIHGQEVYSGGFIYKFFKGAGWVRWAVSAF